MQILINLFCAWADYQNYLMTFNKYENVNIPVAFK